MNIEQVHLIEGLSRAACHLHGTETASKLMGVIDKMIEPEGSAEEIQALEASNRIKQANINLLASKVLEFCSGPFAGMASELEDLARLLLQEDPDAPAAVVN